MLISFTCKTRQRKAWHPLAGGNGWPWNLTQCPKINRITLLILNNLHVYKFESDRAKTVVCTCIVSTRFYSQSAKVDLDLWPRDPKMTLKFDPMPDNQQGYSSHPEQLTCEVWKWPRKKAVVCIVPSRFYRQSPKVDVDFWPRDPKSIGFLLSSSTTYMWSFIVIGQKLLSVSCPQGFIVKVIKLTLTFDPVTQNQ